MKKMIVSGENAKKTHLHDMMAGGAQNRLGGDGKLANECSVPTDENVGSVEACHSLPTPFAMFSTQLPLPGCRQRYFHSVVWGGGATRLGTD